MIPTPVQANVFPIQQTQKSQIVVEEKTGADDSQGVLPIHPEVIQPADNKPIQEPQKVDVQSNNSEREYRTKTVPLRKRVLQTSKPQAKVQAVERKPESVETRRDNSKSYSKEEVINLINAYSKLYGISLETPLCIAKLESGYNQFSANKHSTAKGVFQYLNGTWKATDEGKAGMSVMDADANVKAAVKYMAIHKNTRPWVAAPQCPRIMFSVPNS
jgi:hypothetical protein